MDEERFESPRHDFPTGTPPRLLGHPAGPICYMAASPAAFVSHLLGIPDALGRRRCDDKSLSYFQFMQKRRGRGEPLIHPFLEPIRRLIHDCA